MQLSGNCFLSHFDVNYNKEEKSGYNKQRISLMEELYD